MPRDPSRHLPGRTDLRVHLSEESLACAARGCDPRGNLDALAANGLKGAYDLLPHLQAFHRFIFQDIYPWAGELRTVPLAKPGSMFALPKHIENNAAQVLRELDAEQHLRGLSNCQELWMRG